MICLSWFVLVTSNTLMGKKKEGKTMQYDPLHLLLNNKIKIIKK